MFNSLQISNVKINNLYFRLLSSSFPELFLNFADTLILIFKLWHSTTLIV